MSQPHAQPDPKATPFVPVTLRRVGIRSGDGQPLTLCVYEPDVSASATVLALPGIGVPQRAFRHVASWLSRRGLRVVSVDYRGVGESIPVASAGRADLTAWATEDAPAALRFVQQTFSSRPVLLAHSFGGQALGLADRLHEISGAILVGSQLGHRRHWSGVDRLKLEAFWRTLLPLASGISDPLPRWLIGEAIPRAAAEQWQRWALADDWLFSFFPEAADRFARFGQPITAFAVSDDVVAPPRAVSDLLSRFTAAPVTRIDVKPSDLGLERVGHVGLFRPRGTATIWESWLQFSQKHAAPFERRDAPPLHQHAIWSIDAAE